MHSYEQMNRYHGGSCRRRWCIGAFIRNNWEALEALGIVFVDGLGWRLNLSFRTKAERRNPVMPKLVDNTFTEAVDALLTEILPPERYGDPRTQLVEHCSGCPNRGYYSIIRPRSVDSVVARLMGTEGPDIEMTISVGPAIEQTAITDTTEVAA